MKLQPKTTYKDGNGLAVNIAGLAGYEVDGLPVYWSIQGNHYTESGHHVFSRQKPGTKRSDLILEKFTRSDSWMNVAAEVDTEAARRWWDNVAV